MIYIHWRFYGGRYYNLDAYYQRQAEKEMKKGFKKVLQSERTVFNDEEQRRYGLNFGFLHWFRIFVLYWYSRSAVDLHRISGISYTCIHVGFALTEMLWFVTNQLTDNLHPNSFQNLWCLHHWVIPLLCNKESNCFIAVVSQSLKIWSSADYNILCLWPGSVPHFFNEFGNEI